MIRVMILYVPVFLSDISIKINSKPTYQILNQGFKSQCEQSIWLVSILLLLELDRSAV